jgi:ABC-type cobalamin/Fe3+-siderophores transport system ATPase subunit
MNASALLTINNLSFQPYRNFHVSVESLAFETGIYHLLGANGAGKSTFLDCIAGLYPSAYKNLTLCGQSYTELSLQVIAQRRAYLTQSSPPLFSITGYDMLSICFDKSIKELKSLLCYHPIIQGLETEHLLEKPIQFLSGGEQQRCYLSAALLGCDELFSVQSTLLLLDEPFNGLDIKHTLWLIEYLETISHRVCVIASHHEINFALKTQNPCLLLKKGELIGYFAAAKDIKKQHLIDCFELDNTQISYENDAYYQISWSNRANLKNI